MRLINADDFKERIANSAIKNNLNIEFCTGLIELIDLVDTALDIDELIEQVLKHYVCNGCSGITNCYEIDDYLGCSYYCEEYQELKDLINNVIAGSSQ